MGLGIGLGVGLAIGSGVRTLPITSGLIGYYDFGEAANLRGATDGSGSAVANSGEIKWVRDLSPNGKHLILSTASGPTWIANSYNGLGCGRFNANALTTASNVGITNNECTMVFIGNISSLVGSNKIIMVATTSYSTAGSNWFGISGVTNFYKLEASGSPVDLISALPCNDSKLHCFSAALAGGSTPLRTIRSDGVAEYTDSTGTSYSITDNRVSVGGFNTIDYFIGDCCAALVYNRKLSQSELSQVELFLADQYGLNITGTTWQNSYNAIQRASLRSATLNANQLGTSADPLKYDFDAEDVDELGTYNASLTDLATVSQWNNKGSAAGTGNATQGTDANRPILQKNLSSDFDAVVFGGNFDYLTIGSSDADLAFISNANTHDIWVVGRKDLASRQVFFSSTDLNAEKGFVFDFDSSGKLHYSRTNGTNAIKSVTLSTATSVGDMFVARAYAFSSSTGVTEYNANLGASGTNTNAVGSGNATNTAVIGSLASTASGSFDGALFRILVFNVALDATSVAEIAAYLQARYV